MESEMDKNANEDPDEQEINKENEPRVETSVLACRVCDRVRWSFSSNPFGNKYTLLIEFNLEVEGVGNPEELRERFEVLKPPL